MPEESHLEFYKRWQRLAGPYFKWQHQQFEQFVGNRVADIGCGLGTFAPLLSECEKYIGVEPDPELRAEFKRLHNKDNVFLADCGDACDSRLVAELKSHDVDTIISINVLEHIRDDRTAFGNMVKAVTDGGYICLILPAGEYLFGSLDELDNHYRRYSKKTIRDLAAGLPVVMEKNYYMNVPGAIGWFIKGRVLREKKHGDENYTLMNMLLPFIRRMEGLIHPPFGMSLVAVFSKRT